MSYSSEIKKWLKSKINTLSLSTGLWGWPKVTIKGKPQNKIVVNQVEVRPIQRKSQNIQTWRNAIIWAEGPNQQRQELYDLYTDMLSDGHLYDAMDKRIKAVSNRPLTFMVKGKEDEAIKELTTTSYFRTFVKEVIKSIFWGHSLLELYWPAKGTDTPGETLLIPRGNVKPRFGVVTKHNWETEGIPYRDIPNIVEIGDKEDLGLLMPAAQYVIYKRGNFGDWAEFAEIFGMPFRWATYQNESSREVLKQALAEAGSAGYVVAPMDANIQFLNTNTQNGSEVFANLRSACNEEISITILGNAMTTTEAKSSGYAQSNTQKEVQEEKHRDDRAMLLSILNEKLRTYLGSLGYAVEGGKFMYEEEETMSLKERLEIDLKVSEKVPVGKTYWYETYKIPVPKPSEIEDEDPEPAPDDEAPKPNDPKAATKKKPVAAD